jgi:hypothetical protein
LSIIGLKLELPVVADVNQVRRDRFQLPAPSRYLYHDFRHTLHGAPDLFDLSDSEPH